MTGGSTALYVIRQAAEAHAAGKTVEFDLIGNDRRGAIVWSTRDTVPRLVIRGSAEEMQRVLPDVQRLYRGMLPCGGVQ